MATQFKRPTLQELIERGSNDMRSRLPGVNPLQRRSLAHVHVRTLAGTAYGLHGHLDWNARQLFPDTCDEDQLPRFGERYKVPRKAAEAATGDVTATGTDGSVIPAGTELQSDQGLSYTTDAEVTISGGTATITVTAEEAGADGNLASGAVLSLISPLAGVETEMTVAAAGIGGGADIEPAPDWRARIVDRMSVPPQGGAKHDYVSWAKEVAGVTRAWCYPNEMGDGTVTLRFMMDDTYDDGLPQTADVQAVQDYIDARRPVGMAGFGAVAPVGVPLDPTILLSPNTTAVQAAVEAELLDLLRRAAEPGGTLLISHLREAISVAAGEVDHDLTSHSADITHATGEIPVLGTITWGDLV